MVGGAWFGRATIRILSAWRRAGDWSVLLPVLVAVVTCLPDLSLGYFWDDYYFLTSSGYGGHREYLLPDPHAMFYRPLSQGMYFHFLRLVDPARGTLGHILNLALLAGSIALLTLLVSKLRGRRAGLFSGLLLASLGLSPSLVAWISCSQDLLAVVFVLAAFLLRHERKNMWALASASAAVLCKEPAIATFPVLLLWDRLVGRSSSSGMRVQVVAYAAVALAWIFIHPGIRLLLGRGLQSGATGYVGMEHPERWGPYLLRYLASLVNLAPPGLAASWWHDRILYGLTAIAILVAGVLHFQPHEPHDADPNTVPFARVAGIAALFSIPTLLMPAVLIRHWAPYFAFIPAIGLTIFLGPLLAIQRTAVVVVVLAGFLLLGIHYRGITSEQEPVWTERVFAEAARAANVVRANFRSTLPTIPRESQMVVSVSSTGIRGIYSTMIDGQALRVWYGDPTLQTVSTQTRRHGASTEYLVRVTSDLDVIAIDFDAGQIRTTTGTRPASTEIGRPILNYARAVAAEGNTDRALRITRFLVDSPTTEIYARRLAAMILLAAGRRDESSRLLSATPVPPREVALDFVWTMLKEASYDQRLDEAAFEAFGLSSSDPEAIRWVMRAFQKEGSLGQAAWYGQRLLQLDPDDRESAELLLTAKQMGIEPNRMPAT